MSDTDNWTVRMYKAELKGMEEGIKASQMGHNVVMSPTTYAYLDYTQGDYSVENRIYASLSLEKSYSFDPIPEGAVATAKARKLLPETIVHADAAGAI